jgi:hypothetical protein
LKPADPIISGTLMIVILRGRSRDDAYGCVKAPGPFDGSQVRLTHPAAEFSAAFK